MRLSIFLLLAFVFAAQAKTFSQSANLTLDMSKVRLIDVLNEIEEQTDYYFYFNLNLDKYQVGQVKVENQDIKNVLNTILKDLDLTYEIVDRYIVIKQIDENGENAGFSQQQVRAVMGKVTDSSEQPLPGVSVVIKGTTKGIITDFEGKYLLKNIPDEAILVFSFVGMKTQEISVGRKTTMNVMMEDETVGIEEVVAIGYGTVRRKDLTGSVASVSGSALKDIPVTSAAQAIVGRMAGVQVTKTEGSPDADIKIRVRGGGSITQDNSPLYIVDGFPVESINDIAATDIESIDILKDASSTAIYGARGANGVVLISTKGGSEGKGKINYNTYYGIKNITKTLDVLSPYEYVYWQYELQGTGSTNDKYFGDFQDYKLYKQMEGTNWQDEVFGRTGTSMYHNLAASGGSKIFRYNASLTYNDEEEIMIGSGYNRTNLNIKTFSKVNDWISIDLSARLSDTQLKGAGTSSNSQLVNALQYRPVNGLMEFIDYTLTDDDYDTSNAYILNPVEHTNDDYRRAHNLIFNFNGAATIKILKSLNYRLEYGSQYGETNNKRFYGINTYNVQIYGEQPMANIGNIKSFNYRLANVLTYSKRDILPGNNLTVMVGEELTSSKSESVTSSAKYFPKYIDAISALSMMSLGTPDPLESFDYPAIKVSSLFGRLNYDYKGRYLLSATFRADGSSKFAPGYQWGYFPSAALAWRASDEKFMNFSKKWLSDLKIRASYGESGNNRISDNAWRKTFSIYSKGLYLDGNEISPSAYLQPNSILSNPKLKWETTITRNIGLDYGLFNQRISGSVELYKNSTKDLLISTSIPSSTGYSNQWQNIGETSNKGLELVLNAAIVEKKDFRLSVSFNIGFNRNKIEKLGDVKQWEQSSNWYTGAGAPTGDYLIKEGGQIGTMYGYVTDGMYSFDDFDVTYNPSAWQPYSYKLKTGVPDDSGLIGARRFWPGALKLKDQNGDGIVNNAYDKVVIGNANPKHTGGFNLTAQYKSLDVSAFFNWVYGNDVYNANKLFATSYLAQRFYKNILNVMNSDNRFIYIDKETGAEVGDPVKLAEMNKNATIWSPANVSTPLHSWAIEDGSFLRLNNITIGYSLPKNFLNKLKIQQMRIYATAYNVWTWTNYSGYDPEVDTRRATPLTPGVDYCAYPRSRSFNIGLNVEF